MDRRYFLLGLGAAPVLAQAATLRVAADPTLGLPYFARAHQSYAGFEWEILRALGKILGRSVRITEVLWPQQRQVLIQGGVDLIFNAQEASDLDPKTLLATQPYYTTSQSLVATTPLRGLSDLVGLRVGVLKGSGGAALVDAYNLYKSKGVRLFTAASAEDLIDRLVKQQLDSVVLDTPLAQWLAPRAKLKVAQPVFLPVSYVGVVQAGNQELKIALDQGLQQLAQTSTLEMICRKWNLWNDLQMQLRRPS